MQPSPSQVTSWHSVRLPQLFASIHLYFWVKREALHRGGGRGTGCAKAPPSKQKFGGLAPLPPPPPHVSVPKISLLLIFGFVIFSQIISPWPCLAKYYFVTLFEQLHPEFVQTNNAKDILRNICLALCTMSHTTFQNTLLPLHCDS